MSNRGHIKLSVIKFMEGQSLQNGVVANLRLNRSDDQNLSLEQRRKRVVVPIGDNPTPLELELASGWWGIEIELPWGELLQEDIKLNPGETKDIILKTENSPREFLSWHHYSGGVSGKNRHRKLMPRQGKTRGLETNPQKINNRQPRALENVSNDPRKFRRDIRKNQVYRVSNETESLESIVSDSFPTETGFALEDIAETIRSSETMGHSPDGKIILNRFKAPSNLLSWQSLVNIDGQFEDIPFINFTRFAKEEKNLNDIYEVFHFFGDGDEHSPRNWAHISAFGERRLLSIPAPWPEKEMRTMDANFEILVHFIESEQGLAQLMIKDADTAALLAYLTHNKLSQAWMIADQAQDWLFEKYSNPFAATAGGYVLLGTHLDNKDQQWVDWIKNLSNSFAHIPDGKILEGALYLNGHENIRDFDRAAKCFKSAFERGIPYFTLGFSWLYDGLSVLTSVDPSLSSICDIVGQISRMVETQRPFTTLQLPSELE